MEFYFDINFINSLMTQKLNELVFDDFKSFISKIYNSKTFILYHKELDFHEIEDNPFYKTLLNASTPTIIEYDKLENILTNETGTGFKYFFMKDNKLENDISSDYGYFNINSNQLNEKWKCFSTRDDLEKYISRDKGRFNFTSWTELSEFIFPINSLIIVDRYIFSKRYGLKFNLFSMLESIGLKPLNKRKVDIVIIGNEYFGYLEKKKEAEKKNLKYSGNDEFIEAFEMLNKKLTEIFGKSDCYNLTFLRTDKETIPTVIELHMRAIITNTIIIKCGTSFTFFEDYNKVSQKNTEYISFGLFLNSSSRGVNKEPLDLLKRAFNKIEDKSDILKVKVYNSKECSLFD